MTPPPKKNMQFGLISCKFFGIEGEGVRIKFRYASRVGIRVSEGDIGKNFNFKSI